ncbi:hypothetical protein HY085_00450 [Candidatus Gottesmanbacteria bacterium]|nr:hypothetical protein [Candidatus Gottesmanbacteria bacterium]
MSPENKKKIAFAITTVFTLAFLFDLATATPAAEPPKSEPKILGAVAARTGIFVPTETPTPRPSLTPEPSRTLEPKTPTKTRVVVSPSPSPDPVATNKNKLPNPSATPTKDKKNSPEVLAPGQQKEFKVPNVAGGLQFGIVSKNPGALITEIFAPEQITPGGQVMDGQKHKGALSYDKNAGLKDAQGKIIIPFDLSASVGNVNNVASEQQNRSWILKVKNTDGESQSFWLYVVDIAKGCAYFLRYEPPVSDGWPICKDKNNENEWKRSSLILDLAKQAVA